jgi:hypothetical protein
MTKRLNARVKTLSPEMKKLVWAAPESNAGVGWIARGDVLRSTKQLDLNDPTHVQGMFEGRDKFV